MVDYIDYDLNVIISSDVKETIASTIIKPIQNSSKSGGIKTRVSQPSVEDFLEYFLERVITEEMESETFFKEFGNPYMKNWH